MTRSKKEMIIQAAGSAGEPISDLVAGWTFRIEEIANSVYRANAVSARGRTVFGLGVSAEAALNDCVRKIGRIDSLTKTLSDLGRKVRRLFGFRR